MPATGDLESTLRAELAGDVLFDDFARGRYSTDASIYQIQPRGVVVVRSDQDVVRAVQIAAEAGVPIVPRGAGTSQSGQSIGDGLVIDTSKYLTTIGTLDEEACTIDVEPGVVLDHLNAHLRPHGLWFPVDVSTSAQATIGGMAGNNSAGTRSLRYGLMVDNVVAIDAVLADGREVTCGPGAGTPYLEAAIKTICDEYADAIARRPDVLRNVAGYNLHRVRQVPVNLAGLLVGSEGTLAFFTRLRLQLHPLPFHRVLGVCQFPSLHAALDSTRHIVGLGPSAVELVDRRMLDLARDIPAFGRSIARFVKGESAALLFVEFAGENPAGNRQALSDLDALMGTLGFPGDVMPAVEPWFQSEIWAVRKAALNIVMSMKGDGKPVSFIEDCAVPLDHLAEYADALTEIFEAHGTTGTWYAHASVGCLHVRPVLNLKLADDVGAMRSIAEQCHELVRTFGGAHSGEHGDGLVRSEFLEPMLGPEMVRAFERVKDAFDPGGVLNPGKIVHASRMDDRSLFRFAPDYAVSPVECGLDWSAWGGLGGAVEMCNNNGACRKTTPGVMCPSYRVTLDEQHSTRGRANSLRLALSGQLGPDALTSDAMAEAMELCVGCKACRLECPTGVDMSRMKTEFLHQRRLRRGLTLMDRLVGYLPRYAGLGSKWPGLFNLPGRSRGLAKVLEFLVGFSATRTLPAWRDDPFRASEVTPCGDGREVALLVDTFTTYFEPENARAAAAVLAGFGYRVVIATSTSSSRPLCCGRTFLNVGLLDEARLEARRLVEALVPIARRGVPIVGLEPSCLLTFRDELLALLPGAEASVVAERSFLLDEFLVAEVLDGATVPTLRPLPASKVLVHGHCHQKAFGIADATTTMLRWIPDLEVVPIESGCCGMAGSFGYDARHDDVSTSMAELDLLPAVRAADPQAWVAATGMSCRHQIMHGTKRDAAHPVGLLALALPVEDP